MRFFKRSGTYNVYSFGRVGYKNDVKTATNMGTHVFMQASDCVIIYLNKNKFCVALSTICDTFLHINKQKCAFHFLGEISFLGYKVCKLIFFSGLCLNFILYIY